jgi:hypothetical protein
VLLGIGFGIGVAVGKSTSRSSATPSISVHDDGATPTDTPSPSSTPPTPAPTPTPTPTSTNAAFGGSFTWTDGVSVTVAAPAPYEPSKYAAGTDKFTNFVSFQITINNGTAGNFDPSQFYATVSSASTEGDQVYDSANNINGAPDTAVLPGRQVVFQLAFGVQDPADLVMEVRPGFEYKDAIFTT